MFAKVDGHSPIPIPIRSKIWSYLVLVGPKPSKTIKNYRKGKIDETENRFVIFGTFYMQRCVCLCVCVLCVKSVCMRVQECVRCMCVWVQFCMQALMHVCMHACVHACVRVCLVFVIMMVSDCCRMLHMTLLENNNHQMLHALGHQYYRPPMEQSARRLGPKFAKPWRNPNTEPAQGV